MRSQPGVTEGLLKVVGFKVLTESCNASTGRNIGWNQIPVLGCGGVESTRSEDSANTRLLETVGIR